MRSEAAAYARKANRLTVRHPDGDVVAVLEIVSPGNKDSRHAIRAFARKSVEFLYAGVHPNRGLARTFRLIFSCLRKTRPTSAGSARSRSRR